MIPGCVKTPWNVWTTMVSQAASLRLGQQLTSFVQVSTSVSRPVGLGYDFPFCVNMSFSDYIQECSIHTSMQYCILGIPLLFCFGTSCTMFVQLGGQMARCGTVLLSAQVPRLYVNTEIKANVCNYQAGRSESENLTRAYFFWI